MAIVRRVFICDNCDYSFEEYMDRDEKLKVKCPSCKKNKLYQDLSGVYVGVSNVTTIGQLAEKNTKSMGRYELENKYRQMEIKEKEEKKKREDKIRAIGGVIPEYKSPIPETPKNVRQSIESQSGENRQKRIEKYIMEGK